MSRHAKYRPPSAASRWLSCSASAEIMALYPNDSNAASERGDEGHFLLNTAIEFGTIPDHPDIDLFYMAKMAYEHAMARKAELKATLYSEIELDIPETGEFGTADLVYVGDNFIEIEDFKTGYVPVDVNKNAQLMTYLLGAIAKFGERKRYRIGVIQPQYVHRDGMIRHYDVTQDDVDWFRKEVQYAMTNNQFAPGKHCKTTYCPHRGSCAAFNAWSREHLADAYFPGEIGGMTDDELGDAADHADILQGQRDQIRGEILRRIVNQGRQITGYKVVKGKLNRDYASNAARDKIFNTLRELGVTDDELYEKVPISIAGVERVFKRIYKNYGRGAWAEAFDRVVTPDLMLDGNRALTVEKEIDGRKPYKRGSEFTPLTPTNEVTNHTPLPDLLANDVPDIPVGLSIL